MDLEVFKSHVLETENNINDKFKEIKKVLKIASPGKIEEATLEEIHELIYKHKSIVYEITPLDKVKVAFFPSDHREKMRRKKIKSKCVYTCNIGSILKSEKNIERYYLKGASITSEMCIFGDRTVINLTTKNYIILDKEFARLMILFFNSLKDKAIKV